MTGTQTVQDQNQPAGAVPATPAGSGQTPTDDPAAELARLRKEKAEADKRLAEKDAFISELTTDKATLEQRLSGFQAVNSVIDPVEPSAPEEPAAPKGGTPVSQISGVRAEDIPEIIERTTFINKIKDDNKDMIDFGLEPIIEIRADQLLRQGKPFKEAIATAVKEQREKFDKLKQPTTPTNPTPPAGVRSEDGTSSTPEPFKNTVPDTLDDEGEGRRRARMAKGL